MQEPKALDLKTLLKQLPARKAEAHKGNFGHVLVIGGDFGYPGAPILSALGALRVGAGLVTVASHRDTILGLNAAHPEIMAANIDEPAAVSKLLTKATVVVLGPGLGRTSWSEQVFNSVINTQLPLVLDADGLYFLAKNPSQRVNYVITPHPGEAGMLLSQDQAVSSEQRLDAIVQLINQTHATVALKGAGTLVGTNPTEISICKAGNPGMASAGMGDLLTGIIAGLIAQGLSLDIATKLGVCLHAVAGDQAIKHGQRTLIATDLLEEIKKLL
jgi:hydroxyethylthiazole kinase-like uncharacterized protein yjeF